MLKKLIPILLLTTFSLPAQSLFDDALQEDLSSSVALNYELNGYARSGIYVGPAPGKSGYESKDRYGEAALKLRLRKGQWGDAYSELRFRNTNNSESSTSSFTIREAYVSTYLGAFDLRIGQQVVQWGKADGYNPTNVITPLDLLVFSPDEDDRRISNFLIRLYYNWSVLRLEAIWVPIYGSSVLPFSKVELPEGVQLSEPDYPDEAIENSAIALRLHYEGVSLDGTLSYFNGFLPMPGLSARTENSMLNIFPTAYRIQMIGADFSTTVGAYGLRGEFAYREPDEEDNTRQYIPNKQVEYILGLDREFGNFSLIIQYIGKHVLDYEDLTKAHQTSPEFAKYKIALWNRLLSGQLKEWIHAISFRLAWNLCHETLSLELLGQINLSTEETFLKPKLSYDLTDDLTLSAGAQIYHGPDNTLFGLLDKNNSAGFIELKASF
jgi:hypothetical protein